MTDTKMLRDKINDRGLKYSFVAEQLGLTTYGFQRKVENDSEFKASEIQRLFILLDLSEEERNAIFFA